MEVPLNQRSYAWTDKEVKEYLQDIEKALTAGSEFYYLGAIVLRQLPRTEVLQIVDGQQRLATTSIILALVRDYVYADGDLSTATKLAGKYLKKEETWGNDSVPRLKLNSVDNEFFLTSILATPGESERDSISPSKESHRRLLGAREVVRKYFESKPVPARIKVLKEWDEFLEKSVQALVCTFGSETNPYTLFETLNGRGLSLTTGERVKNYLFGLSEDKLDSCLSAWYEMVGALEAVDADQGEDLLDTYLRHCWIARTGKVTRTISLFPDIREQVTKKAEAMKLVSEISQASKLYHKFLSPTEDNWNDYDPACAAYMDAINTMGVVQIRPLILSVLQKFPKKEVKSAMRLLVDASMRLLVSRSAGTGFIESAYASAVSQVNDGKVNNSSQLRAALRPSIPDDSAFEKEFAAYSLSKKPLIRYVLRVLEKQNSGTAEPALIPNPSKDVVNIEHVLPQKPHGNYTSFKPEQAKAYVNRIGNLALMQSKVNAKVGNSDFSTKKSLLLVEPFQLTHSIGALSEWTPSEIDRRQVVLAKLAVKAWPFK